VRDSGRFRFLRAGYALPGNVPVLRAFNNRIPEELTAELKRAGLPFAVVDNRIESPGICCISGENESTVTASAHSAQ